MFNNDDDALAPGIKSGGAPVQISYNGPDINKMNPYEFVRHADMGTGGFETGEFLIPHTRERMLEERKQYSYYPNFVKRIINALVDPIYREEPKRYEETGNQLFQNFLDNCNKKGTSWGRFIHDVARKVRRYGMGFIVVDNDRVTAETRGDAILNDQRPYVYFVSPERVSHYKYDQRGALTLLSFFEYRKEGDKKIQYRRTITKDGWILEKKEKEEWVKDSEGVYSIRVIPAVPIYDELPDEEDDPVMTRPPIYHIARLNLALMNMCSEMREVERGQMFSLLTLPAPDGTKISNAITIGIGNAIPYNPKDGGKPAFISPDPAILEAVMKDRDFLISQIFEMASVLGVTVKGKNDSGWKREVEFQTSNQNLVAFTRVMQASEMATFNIVVLFLREKLEPKSEYSTNFGMVDDLAEITKMQESLAVTELPKEVKAEVMKDWIAARFRNRSVEEIKELQDYVDADSLDQLEAEPAQTDPALSNAA